MQLEYDVPALSGRPGHWTLAPESFLPDHELLWKFPFGWMSYAEAHGVLLLERTKNPHCNYVLFGRN